MTTKNPECECPIGPEFQAAGLAAGLCHHSSLQSILEVKEALEPVCEKILRRVDLETLFKMAPRDGIEYYIKKIAQENAKSLTVHQRAILTASYFRDYSALIQYAGVHTLEDLKRSGTV